MRIQVSKRSKKYLYCQRRWIPMIFHFQEGRELNNDKYLNRFSGLGISYARMKTLWLYIYIEVGSVETCKDFGD